MPPQFGYNNFGLLASPSYCYTIFQVNKFCNFKLLKSYYLAHKPHIANCPREIADKGNRGICCE